MHKANGETNTATDAGDEPAKYACRNCGSNEVGGNSDTYPVFRAEGDKLIYLRSESNELGVLALYCNICQRRIEVDDIGEIKIE